MTLTKIAKRRLTEVPIGTILPHYNYNGLLTFDTAIYKYCDGSVVADIESPLNTHTLPDMSNRYLVGFGTEGGGDIDTAAWPVGPETANWTVIGNASHQINLEHLHIISGLTALGLSGVTATHTHHHGSSTLQAQIGSKSTANFDVGFIKKGSGFSPDYNLHGVSANGVHNDTSWGTAISGVTDGANTATVTITDGDGGKGHTHGFGALVNAKSLSTTQTIQPRSMRCRFIIRIK